MIIKNRKQDKPSDRILFWVGKAASMDDTRYFMKSILFVPNGEHRVDAIATDGYRLHLATFDKSTVDAWGVHVSDDLRPVAIERRSKTELILGGIVNDQYPNYRRVIPESPAYMIATDEFNKEQPQHFYGHMVVAMQDAGYLVPRFNPEYIVDAAEIAPTSVRFDGPDKAFRFDAPDQMAVVMPKTRVL
jgi:hypothetical protein